MTEGIDLGFAIFPPIQEVAPPKFLWTQAKFVHFLMKKVDFVDGISYSASPYFPARIRRLILSITPKERVADHLIMVSNTHAKLYICYAENKPNAAFVGSMNAVGAKSHELLFKLETKHLKETVNYFEELWKHNQTP